MRKTLSLVALALAATACTRLERIEPAEAHLSLASTGEERKIEMKGFDKAGQEMKAVKYVFESDHPAIVEVDAKGVVHAVSSGEAVIHVTAADRTADVHVDVSIPASVAFEFGPSLALTSRDPRALAADVRDHRDRKVASAAVVYTVESGDGNVVTLSNGMLAAVANGQAVVRASYGSLSAVLNVTVSLPEVAAAMFNGTPPEALAKEGGVADLSVVFRDAAGAEVPGIAAQWSSSDPAVATVDANGHVTAVAEGKTVISVTGGGQTLEHKLKVE